MASHGRGIRSSAAWVGVVVVLVAACGTDSGGDVTAGDEAGTPEGLAIEAVAAGGDEGWVVARADDGGSDIWRLTLEGASQIASIPEYQSLEVQGSAEGLDVAGLRCVSEERDPCQASVAELVTLDSAGDVTREATLWRQSTSLDDGDGLTIVGRAEGTTWVSTERGIHPVDAGGSIAEPLPHSDGAECVLDGELFAIAVSGGDGAAQESGDAGRPATDVIRADDRASSTFEITRYVQGSWQPVPGSTRSAAGSSPVRPACGANQFEMEVAGEERLVARWTPEAEWEDVQSDVPSEVVDVTDVRGTFARTSDDEVLERQSDGSYVPTGLDLRDLSAPGAPPPHLSVDAYDGTVIGCVSGSAHESTSSDCDLSINE